MALFGRSKTWWSIVFNATIKFFEERFYEILRQHPQLNDYGRVRLFEKAIMEDEGFVDRSFVGFSRPNDNIFQRRYTSKFRNYLRTSPKKQFFFSSAWINRFVILNRIYQLASYIRWIFIKSLRNGLSPGE
jgi:hypothetical protein